MSIEMNEYNHDAYVRLCKAHQQFYKYLQFCVDDSKRTEKLYIDAGQKDNAEHYGAMNQAYIHIKLEFEKLLP